MNKIIVMSEKIMEQNRMKKEYWHASLPQVEKEMYIIRNFLVSNPQLFEDSEVLIDCKGLYFVGYKKDNVYEIAYTKKNFNQAVVMFSVNGEVRHKREYTFDEKRIALFKFFTTLFFDIYYEKAETV